MKDKHSNFKSRIGEIHTTNEGYKVEIISYENSKSCCVNFIHDTTIIINDLEYGAIKGGRVKNPFHITVYGKGFYGMGKYKAWDNEQNRNTKSYITWKGMIERCYSDKNRHKYKSYKNVTVCEEWHNYQNFAQWFEENYIEGWQLDKDIICKDCKIYSPETCCFVPQEINVLFKTHGYKNTKGIYVGKGRKKYQVNISRDKKSVFKGSFSTIEEAMRIYATERKRYLKEVIDRWKDLLPYSTYRVLRDYGF